MRSDVVKNGKRPARPQLQDDIGREFDDNLWSLIEECWSQEASNRPTAETVSLRLGGVNGCLLNPAEMYKKGMAALTEELARVKERSKAAIQDLETVLARRELEQAELKKELDEKRDFCTQVEKNADERIKSARQDLETEIAKLRDSLAKREQEKAELEKDLDEERDLRKQVEKNADERSKAARQDLETELAKLRDSLARRELEKAELKKGVDEERQSHKQLEKDANDSELLIQILRTDGPGMALSGPTAIVQKPIVQAESQPIPNGIYLIKNRTGDFYWSMSGSYQRVHFWYKEKKSCGELQPLKGERAFFFNYSSAQRIIVFRSGKSYLMLMVTSPSQNPGHHISRCGLMLTILCLCSQFRGD